MNARYTATALAEIDQILSYIATDNPGAAADLADEIKEMVRRISEHPKLAPVVYAGDVRAIVIGRFDYRIFYVFRDKELIIRNVRSMKRRRPWEG